MLGAVSFVDSQFMTRMIVAITATLTKTFQQPLINAFFGKMQKNRDG